MRFKVAFALGLGLWCVVAARVPAPLSAQGGGMFLGSTEDMAIGTGRRRSTIPSLPSTRN